jgi:hypothetical protein
VESSKKRNVRYVVHQPNLSGAIALMCIIGRDISVKVIQMLHLYL